MIGLRCCYTPFTERRKQREELREALSNADPAKLCIPYLNNKGIIDNLIVTNPRKRPYFTKMLTSILNGDEESSQEFKACKDATVDYKVANLAAEHRDVIGTLSDKERTQLAKRLYLYGKYHCQKN